MTSAILFGVVSAAATNKDFMDPGLLIGELVETPLETQKLIGLQVSYSPGASPRPYHPMLWYVFMEPHGTLSRN